MAHQREPGGFMPPSNSMMTPPASSLASSTVSSALPQPRRQPLKHGSTKEWQYIDYVDKRISKIQRRFDKHGLINAARSEPQDPQMVNSMRQQQDELKGIKGYRSFREMGNEVESLLDVVWASGTPHLQVAHLLALASMTVTALPAFSPAPRTMFRVVAKLDMAFASLITGRDLDSGVSLPGFERLGESISGTERVRIKSVVSRGRIAIAKLMDSGEDFDPDDMKDIRKDPKGDEDSMDVDDDDDDDDYFEDWGVEMSHVFEKSIQELGDELTAEPVGLLIDENPIYKNPEEG